MRKATMATRMAELSLLFLLSIASWSRVEAGDVVTINSFQADVEGGNSVIDSISGDLADNIVGFTMNIKQSCPGTAQMDIELFKGGNLANTMSQTYKQPMKEILDSNLCGSIDAPDPDDDSCSILEGEQTASQCDISSWFQGMDDDDYEAIATITVNGEKVGTMVLGVTVSS
ncbi:uncharacterized protein LOC144471113 [Augochlora pura]